MSPAGGVDVSVVVPALGMQGTLPACVESLFAQRFHGSFEVIVVPEQDEAGALAALRGDPRLRVIARPEGLSAAAARNLGVESARGRLLAFTDADVTVPPDWLERLSAGAVGGRCVAGSVRNGTPGSRVGTTEYLVEFADLHPSSTAPAAHGATCNLIVPRETWEALGPFPEHLGGCEDTLLTQRALHCGLLVFDPRAEVTHHNRDRLLDVLAHQYAIGAAHARFDRFRGSPPRAPGPAALRRAAARMIHLDRRLGEWAPAERSRARRLLPLLVLGFGSWGLGLWREGRGG